MIGRWRRNPATVEINGYTNEDTLVPQVRRVPGDRLVAHPFHGIHQIRVKADTVKMRMTNEDMIDPGEPPEAGITHPGASVNQNTII